MSRLLFLVSMDRASNVSEPETRPSAATLPYPSTAVQRPTILARPQKVFVWNSMLVVAGSSVHSPGSPTGNSVELVLDPVSVIIVMNLLYASASAMFRQALTCCEMSRGPIDRRSLVSAASASSPHPAHACGMSDAAGAERSRHRSSSGRSCLRLRRVEAKHVPQMSIEILEAPPVQRTLVVGLMVDDAARGERPVHQFVDAPPLSTRNCRIASALLVASTRPFLLTPVNRAF